MKLGLILASHPATPLPSTRIAVLNMLPHLHAAGWQTEIVYQSPPGRPSETPDLSGVLVEDLRRFDAVLFQKVHGPSAVELAAALGAAGVPTIFVMCDHVETAMAAACNVTLTISAFLRSLYPAALQPRVQVMHDGVEQPALQRHAAHAGHGSRWAPLRAVLVTSAPLGEVPQIGLPPPWLAIDIVGRYPAGRPLRRLRQVLRQLLDAPGWRARFSLLRFLLHPRIRCIGWTPQAVARALAAADLALVPIDTSQPGEGGKPPVWQVKSANRLTLKMAAGLPVLCTPIPAYEEALEHGVHGLFARDAAAWRSGLEALRDPALRSRLGAAARQRALAAYGPEVQARQLLAALASVRPAAAVAKLAESSGRL